MYTILLHTGERRSRIETPLRHAGYTVVGIKRPAAKLLKFLGLINIIREKHPNLIMVDSAGYMCIAAYILSRLFNISFIIRVRADVWAIYEEQKEYCSTAAQVYEYLLLTVCTALFKRAARLFTVSEYLKNVIKEKGIKEEKIRVMRTAIDCDRFRPGKGEKKGIILLSVSNLTFKKKTEGIIDIIPVIDEIISQYNTVEYYIAGRGQFSYMVVNALKTVTNKDKMHFVGFKKDIETLYSQADIYVHYSHLDAYPTAVLEAMASGLPVIATRKGGIVEQVKETTGFLVDDTTVKKALRTLIENKSLQKTMGETGRALVKESLNLSCIAQQYKKEIDEVLNP
jgi:glycosyltransferase involved in cell wall biosynthesis